jgi:hypothetical protein
MPGALFLLALSTPMTSPSDDLLTRCLTEYWDTRHDTSTLRSRARMRAVAQLLATEIKSWAPDPGSARICHLAINEVADRLLRDTTDDLQP